MTKSFAVLISLYFLAFQSPAQAQELERENLTDIEAVLDKAEQSWKAKNIQELTMMTAEPFSIVTPDGVVRNSYFHPAINKLLMEYFQTDLSDDLDLELSGLSMLNETTAYLQVKGALGESDIVMTALLRKFGDSWKASNLHISNLREKKFVHDE